MDRKAKEGYQITGWVNFPVDNDSYVDSHEGGLFVRLVVIDLFGEDWMQCCGGYQSYIMDENLIYDDKCPIIITDDWEDWLTQSFPRYNTDGFSMLSKYCSRPYLAVLTLGSANWSGEDKQTGEMWHCTFEDLTEEGKTLYQVIQNLYGGNGELHLQTWLDT